MRVNRVRIPRKRIGVAIGEDGEVKKDIENRTNTKIDFDSKTGEAIIKSNDEKPLQSFIARDVLKAIGRGFSPKRAFRLFYKDMYFEQIDITRYAGSSKKSQARLRGRVIGRDGKTRQIIEQNTDVLLSIYGKTIAMIGKPDQLQIARKAVHMLLNGVPHSRVYNFLEKERNKIAKRMGLWRK
ncbi:hypothetical protein AKJ45_02400 [candidate division MSBL1 archaeon SCGC-AAA261F19]|uniref:K Homology domain-containing protein n=1 Tax=candidate division MSBL1 archaeon SCGC-AAA261F19 TaxID=1698275 RepID=A0A133V9K0_9EURY|nr:hypothetical protein AKJ45_02400 [candidate division MSBL1 archaeon SCGC-AAA261F19]